MGNFLTERDRKYLKEPPNRAECRKCKKFKAVRASGICLDCWVEGWGRVSGMEIDGCLEGDEPVLEPPEGEEPPLYLSDHPETNLVKDPYRRDKRALGVKRAASTRRKNARAKAHESVATGAEAQLS